MNIADIAEVQFDAASFWEAAKAHRLLVARDVNTIFDYRGRVLAQRFAAGG